MTRNLRSPHDVRAAVFFEPKKMTCYNVFWTSQIRRVNYPKLNLLFRDPRQLARRGGGNFEAGKVTTLYLLF